jgi:hypothetical protein
MRRLNLGVAVISLFCVSTSLYGSTILSENFNQLADALAVTSAGTFSTINGTNVDIVGPSLFASLCAPPESGSCIDMAGTNGNSQGQLRSNMLFPAGHYLLSFNLIGSQRGITASTTVTFGNYQQLFTLGSTDDTHGIVVNQLVTLGSPGFLLFVSDTPGNVGNLLDNVVVSTPTSTVPEPSSLLLLGTGCLGVVGKLRHRLRR